MLDYDLSSRGSLSRFEYLYRRIRDDIASGTLAADEKLPSKRQLSRQWGVSLITVESALGQLVAEGYLIAKERRGYYVASLGKLPSPTARPLPEHVPGTFREQLQIDTSRLPVQPDAGALALWERSLRGVLAGEDLDEAFSALTPQGLPRLQADIAHLVAHTRGMQVDPGQIVVGAGAQVLYQLVAELLGADAVCAVEDPGFPRIAKTYEAAGRRAVPCRLDGEGIRMEDLEASGATIVHVMPSHQFPTGRVTSIARRYELLGWASEDPARLIVEDDYDCEFRLAGHPIPSLASIDAEGKTIYIGTFSKSLGPVVRAAYAVLPPAVAARFQERLSFAAGTLGVIDQLALARMLEDGSYESHVARYRRQVKERRDLLMGELASALGESATFEEADSGLHMVLALSLSEAWQGREREAEERLVAAARKEGVGLAALSSYARLPISRDGHARFVLQYERLSEGDIRRFARIIGELAEKEL